MRMDGFGHNDVDGTVYCHLCEWSRKCPRGIEEIEAVFQAHLRQAHNLPLLFRIDSEGKKTDIPQ